jgi:Mn2+/Fe2+ NRAMP family transporter
MGTKDKMPPSEDRDALRRSAAIAGAAVLAILIGAGVAIYDRGQLAAHADAASAEQIARTIRSWGG